jgi:hypothetical protein
MTSSVVVLSILLLSICFSSLIGSSFVDQRTNQLDHLSGTPTSQKPVGEVPPNPNKLLASSVDGSPRFVDTDHKSGMLASSGEDTIAFDSLENLLSLMH